MDFSKLNTYFDHVYLITLHRAIERHKKIEEVLQGLNYTFFYGADNKNFTVAELEKQGLYSEEKAKQVHRYHKAMAPGMLGCSLSHRMVYEHILKNQFKRVLILEDDVLPLQAGIELFETILNELPASWDLLYFDYHKNTESNFGTQIKQWVYHIQKLVSTMPWSHTTISTLYAKEYSPHLKRAGYHDFTSAYCITSQCAKILLQIQTPVIFHPDNLLAHACTNKLIQGFITVPKLFEQESQFKKETVRSYVEE